MLDAVDSAVTETAVPLAMAFVNRVIIPAMGCGSVKLKAPIKCSSYSELRQDTDTVLCVKRDIYPRCKPERVRREAL